MGETVKTFIVIFFAALSAAVGESLLSYAMKRSGQLDMAVPSQWFNLIFSVVRNPYIFMGVILLGIYFFLYLAALSWADLSFVLPLTAMSYLFAALLAKFMLNEEVSWFRWVGTIVIMVGIILVALDSERRTVHDYGGRQQVSENGSLNQSNGER
jgi:drug/metabolite transporter (DMT)-like permease